MIVREKLGAYLLIRQYDHSLVSGEFARRWSERPYPLESTLYAISNHDVAWCKPDREVLWNEAADRPYSFVDYPPELKVRAYVNGLDLLQKRDPYAACLCSMHYERLVRGFGRSEAEKRFTETEALRQGDLRAVMSERQRENLGRNLSLLRLCDGLSLFVCLNEPGGNDPPPPYPGGFEFDGRHFESVWEDERALRLLPNPFSEPFGVSIPYQAVSTDRRLVGSGRFEFQVVC